MNLYDLLKERYSYRKDLSIDNSLIGAYLVQEPNRYQDGNFVYLNVEDAIKALKNSKYISEVIDSLHLDFKDYKIIVFGSKDVDDLPESKLYFKYDQNPDSVESGFETFEKTFYSDFYKAPIPYNEDAYLKQLELDASREIALLKRISDERIENMEQNKNHLLYMVKNAPVMEKKHTVEFLKVYIEKDNTMMVSYMVAIEEPFVYLNFHSAEINKSTPALNYEETMRMWKNKFNFSDETYKYMTTRPRRYDIGIRVYNEEEGEYQIPYILTQEKAINFEQYSSHNLIWELLEQGKAQLVLMMSAIKSEDEDEVYAKTKRYDYLEKFANELKDYYENIKDDEIED